MSGLGLLVTFGDLELYLGLVENFGIEIVCAVYHCPLYCFSFSFLSVEFLLGC